MTVDAQQDPRAGALRQGFITLRTWLGGFPVSILLLGLRIGVGSVFFKAGLLKYNSWEMTIMLFAQEYQVPVLAPELAARMAMIQELTVPVLLFLGLATRIATIPLLGMISVIQMFVYPNAWNDHLLWGSALVLLLTRGPGVFSVDHLVDRAFAGRVSGRIDVRE